jgi:hypothetical protein
LKKMQRTPAQSAERRDPSAEQQGPSAKQHSQSAEHGNLSQEQQVELIRRKYDGDVKQHGSPDVGYTIGDVKALGEARDSTSRNLAHLRSQTKALREAVTKAKEGSIKRQVKFLSSAFKEYQDACERVLDEKNLPLTRWNENTSLLDWVMTWGRKDYEEAMSWADDFFERQEKEKAAQEAEALKAAKAQEAEALKAAKAQEAEALKLQKHKKQRLSRLPRRRNCKDWLTIS